MIKVSKISFEGREVDIPGLSDLLSDSRLWTESERIDTAGYTREVIQGKKLVTVYRKKQAKQLTESEVIK